MECKYSRRNWMSASMSLAGAALLASTGCTMVATGLYVLTGNNVPAEYDGLKGKKVAIVCRPTTALDFNNSSVANLLANQVASELSTNVRNVTIVDQRTVNDWTDENTWDQYIEIGKALNADLVVGIDLEEFSIYMGQTLYQGRATIHLAVYDPKKDKLPVWEKHLPQAVYPPTGGIPSSERPEGEFRRKFVGTLADRISRHFYPHDATVDFAPDSTVLY